MLPVALALWGSGLRPATVGFVGWFGPRGLASILFVLIVVEEGRLESGPLLMSVVVLTVLLSAVLHGAIAYPAARRYGAYVSKQAPSEEMGEAADLPVRVRHSEA
jgi:NhaP-type Na+/H+ or K+/H+ antiporter